MGPKVLLHFHFELERVWKILAAGPGDGRKNFVKFLKSIDNFLITVNLFTKLFVEYLRWILFRLQEKIILSSALSDE